MDNGVESIQEDPIKAQIRKQARMVYIKSLALAIVLTVIGIVI